MQSYFCKNNEKPIQPRIKHILLAPLDWGLGHTTRCVPLIKHLRGQQNCRIILAGSDWQLEFLSGYFPELSFELLKGYEVRYAAKGSQLKWRLLQQLPQLQNTIRHEHGWLQRLAENHQLSGIIADNRYGLWHPHIPSVILTHQLQIQSGMGWAADRALLWAHYRQLSNFRQVWVVDTAEKSLACRLSHPAKIPGNATYIGLLSQFYEAGQPAPSGQHHLLILLSGPEPQRSLLSDLLWREVLALNMPVVFVEGKKGVSRQAGRQVQHRDQLQGTELENAITNAKMIVCRAGYSSIMDLVYLKKRAILIPTPGQTEQEYLSRLLTEKGIFPGWQQEGFSLQNALLAARQFPFHPAFPPEAFSGFKPVLDQWLAGL